MADNVTNETSKNNKGKKESTNIVDKLKNFVLEHKIISGVIIVTIVIIILSVSDYHDKKKYTKEDPSDPKNAPAAANEFINNVYVDENGILRTEKSIRELWTELKEKGNMITKYLNSPEEFAKLLSASMATDYPDTRANPDQPIDWSKYDISIDSTEVQGIVKFKRALASNKTITMTYLPPSEFQEKISKYNESGKASDRDEALKYFTIEKTYDSSSAGGLVNVGSRAYNDNVLNVENIVDVVNTTGDLGYGKRYEAVQSGCFDGKYLICAMNKWGNGEGKIIWINYETKKIDSSIVLSGSEVGHMEGMTYDSNNKWVIVGVSGSRVLAINNFNKSKIYVKTPRHFSHYAYSVSTHELLGYHNKKITFMKYDASKNEYIEQRTITLNGANITHIQGISCDGQVIFLSDSRPISIMNSDNYRVWAFDYQGNKVEEHSIGTGWKRGTKEIENCTVDKNGNLILFFPHMIAIAQGYKANPVDWENSTAANSTTSTTSTTGSNTQVEEILKYACSWIGKIDYDLGADDKLVDGGKSDCSHFVHRVFEHFGLMDKFVHSLDWGKGGGNGGCPGTVDIGTDMSKASPGDVIWEHYGSGSHNHVYIYMGKDKNGKYKKVQCANTNHAQGVYISNVNTKEVDAILHFEVLPTDPNAYFDPDTGILHTSSGNTTSANTSGSSTSSTATDNSTTTTNSPTSSNTNQIADILKYACSWEGKVRYVIGKHDELKVGARESCSGFVYRVYEHFGLMSEHKSAKEWSANIPGIIEVGSDLSQASPGDIIWRKGSDDCHVSIYLGNKRRVHSTPGHNGVNIANISQSAVHKIFHFRDLPLCPGAYFDPKTGVLHKTDGTTVLGDDGTGISGEAIVQEAEKYVGKLPYVWGGSSLETGADCSGFCWAILHKLGLYSGSRITTVGFETAGKEVPSLSEAQAGDMIVYGPGKGQSYHMAIYDGHGGIIHEADEQEDCKHGSKADFAKILTIRRFTNNSGSSTESSGNNTTTTNQGSFKVKVATWQENTEKVVSTEKSENKSEHNYNMNEITIPYQSIVAQYRMPFNYLWTMLIYSNNDKNYTFDLADLVRNSQIEITVHDNLQDTTTVVEESHLKKYHYEGEADVKFNYTNRVIIEAPTVQPPFAQPQPTISTSQGSLTQHGKGTFDTSKSYKKTTTTRNKTNTLDIALTLADTWCVKFEKQYIYDGTKKESSNSSTTYDDIVYKDQDEQISNSTLLNNVIDDAQKNAIKTLIGQGKTASIDSKEVLSSSEELTTTTTDRKSSTNTDTITKKYTAKADNNDTDENPKFVRVFNKHYNARSNILSAKAWFFEALESNANTANMVDLTKYLIYKATGTAIDGIKTYNFKTYNPSDFSEIGVGTLEGNTTEERVWLSLINAGFNDVAAAGAMGNLSYESGGSGTKTIRTDVVEGGYTENNGGIGMCQWTNNNRGTEGRNTQLRKYAQSKGKTWKDETTQIEFLITEITGKGQAKGYANYQFMTKTYGGVTYSGDSLKNVENNQSKIDYATKAFAATFERPSENAFSASMSKRIELANYFYNQFKGKRSTGLPTGNLPFNLEHAINVFDGIHAKENGHLKWQGETVDDRGGTLGCYEEAVNIFNGTNYRIYEIYNILVNAHPELRTRGIEPYKLEDMNHRFNMEVTRAKANVKNVKNALQQGKLVQLMVNTNKWRNSEGKWVSWSGTHSGLIFHFDGTYFHMKAAGTINQKNAIYTEQQLNEWIGNVGNRLVIYTKIK